MTSEIGHGGSGDETTDAIYELIQTMTGGQGSLPEHNRTMSVLGVDNSALNWAVEDELIEAEVFTNRRTDTQLQILGCIACMLNAQPEAEGRCLPAEIAVCRGKGYASTKAVLDKLVGGGLLETTYAYDQNMHVGVLGSRPRLSRAYKYTDEALRSGLKERLEMPPQCGLEAGRKRLQAEKDTAHAEAAKKDPMLNTLGCLICRLSTGEPGVRAQEVAMCKNLDSTDIQAALTSMADGGVLQNGAGVYRFREATGLSAFLQETVAVPKQCGLKHTEQ